MGFERSIEIGEVHGGLGAYSMMPGKAHGGNGGGSYCFETDRCIDRQIGGTNRKTDRWIGRQKTDG